MPVQKKARGNGRFTEGGGDGLAEAGAQGVEVSGQKTEPRGLVVPAEAQEQKGDVPAVYANIFSLYGKVEDGWIKIKSQIQDTGEFSELAEDQMQEAMDACGEAIHAVELGNGAKPAPEPQGEPVYELGTGNLIGHKYFVPLKGAKQ